MPKKNVILNQVGIDALNRPTADIEKLRTDLYQQFNAILLKVNSVEQYNICSQSLKRLVPLLNASEQPSLKPTTGVPQTSKCNPNKRIETQRRFTSKKEKKKVKKTARMTSMTQVLNTAINAIVSARNEDEN